jgi:hypothetical protein
MCLLRLNKTLRDMMFTSLLSQACTFAHRFGGVLVQMQYSLKRNLDNSDKPQTRCRIYKLTALMTSITRDQAQQGLLLVLH